MNRRDLILLLAGALTASRPLRAQQKAIPVIGFLNPTSSEPLAPYVAAFRQGLSKTGYVEGQNVAIEYRWAEGNFDRLPALAADLVRRKVDVIASTGAGAPALAAKNATSTIPVVFVIGSDPVVDGLVASLARPGGNLTGFTLLGVLALAHRLAAICEWRDMAAFGCLASYGTTRRELQAMKAAQIDKMLKGASPADTPVQQPTKFELVLNLKVAREIGVDVPPAILARADEVIE
jgi:putative ABC transport system substrate-binding protein